MRFDVLTLFPELFAPFLSQGVTRRAFESRQVDVRLWPLREHADDNYRRVDDRPYGGGPGMVMLVEPLERAMAAVRADRGQPAPVIHFSPTGRRIDQPLLRELATGPGAVLLCAIFAVGVGGCLFAQRAGWARLIRFVAHPGWGSVAAIALAAGLIAFVAVEPGTVRRWGRRRK